MGLFSKHTLLYDICIVLNRVPLSMDLTVNGPRPWQFNTQFSKKSNSSRTGLNQNSLLVKRQNDNISPGDWPRKISA